MDMSTTVAPKSNQLNADDMIAGPMTITITKVSASGNAEQPVAVSFDGDDGKPFLPCKSMRRVMIAAWGVQATEYVGRSMTLYRDPTVLWGGMAVGGIRISHMSHIDREMVMALTATQKKRVPYTVKPLKQDRPAPALPAPDAGPDKATQVAEALELRAKNAADMQALTTMTGDATVIKQREWLKERRPELAQRVTDAVQAALTRFDDDTFPGDLPDADQQGGEE